MAQPGPIAERTQYVGARLASSFVNALDVDLDLRLADHVGRLGYRLDKSHRQRAAASIAAAFPDWTPQQVYTTVRGAFEHLGKLVVEICHAPTVLTPERWPERVTMNNFGPGIEAISQHKGALCLTGHIGNWEILAYLLALLGYDIDAVARPLDNPMIYDWFVGIRQQRGLRLISKFGASRRMLDVVRRRGVLGFVADQNAGETGLFVPFFGRFASTYKSIGLLALNHDLPILCGCATRVGQGFHHELTCTDIIYPEDWADRRDPLYYVTARYAYAMEQMIRRQPDQYLWMHRRWKSRPRHERQGKPMPRPLRRQVEDLPWMDEPTLERLHNPVEPVAPPEVRI